MAEINPFVKRRFTPLIFVASVLVLTAIAMTVWYFWPSSPSPKVAQTPQANSHNNSNPTNKGHTPSKTGVLPGDSGSTDKSSSSSSSNKSGSSSSGSSTSSTLSNTGPGNTVGLFFGVTAVAGFTHFIYHRRRNNA